MSTSTPYAGSWSSLPIPLTPWVLDVIQSMGYPQMTPVQASTIPLFMKHKDVIVEAVTGSGKTLAFVLPTLEKLIRRETKHRHHEIGALIISPTRELATQIYSVFSLFLSAQPVESSQLTEGDSHITSQVYPPPLLLISSDQSSPTQDIQRFISTGADIVIGTPGRVEEFLLGQGRNTVNVKELEILILDEADRLLDLGFQVAVTRIIMHLPKQRRSGLFSATMTDADAISELVRVGLRNPARVIVKVQAKTVKVGAGNTSKSVLVEERRTPSNLQNYFVRCRTSEKLVQLTRIINHEINHHQSSHFIVYFATCACVDYFYKILPKLLRSHTTLYSLHGNLPPSARTRTLSAFTSAISTQSSSYILLATDVAARGLDIPSVNVVIQFDPPTDPKSFSHRCGRTARAGRIGRAWALLSGRETEYVDFLQIRKIPLQERPYFTDLDHDSSKVELLDQDDRKQDIETDHFLQEIRNFVLTDRVIHDQAMRAYVSFVRAYSKHEASYIFRVKDLDLIGVAKSFGLLRLPKMPELKDIDREGWEDAQIDWSSYAYSDAAQEAKRIAAAAENAVSIAERDSRRIGQAEKKKINVAWSAKMEKREDRIKRKERKVKRRKWEKSQASTVVETNAGGKRFRDSDPGDEGSDDDFAELAREERMAKKVRKGEVSQTIFDSEFADLDT